MSASQPARSDRPPGWQQEHARRYIATGGQDGHIWEGVTTLLLTTTGHRSGEARTTPLSTSSGTTREIPVVIIERV